MTQLCIRALSYSFCSDSSTLSSFFDRCRHELLKHPGPQSTLTHSAMLSWPKCALLPCLKVSRMMPGDLQIVVAWRLEQ